MLLRSAVAVSPVLGGVVAGGTRTVSTVLPVASSDTGDASPKPVGCVGSVLHEFGGAVLLRGIGPITTKSFELSSVSVHPFPFRTAAVVAERSPVVGGQLEAVPY